MARRSAKRRKSPKSRAPSLQFGPSGSLEGFTPAGVTGFSDLNPVAVVRELIQNSLDAAMEVGEDTARVRFRIDSAVPIERIPGLAEYRKALSDAIKSQKKKVMGAEKKLPDHAQAVVRTIKECLDSSTCDVLVVCDNGIGLDKSRMRSVLSSGISQKPGGASGALGNGHEAVIPTSDLRYILYGGQTQNRGRVGSGHAILASHQRADGDYIRSNHGFFVTRLQGKDMNNPYVFPEANAIPKLIADELDQIRKDWNHGSVVIAPGFNHFRESKKALWDTVAQAAAGNFFTAIEKRQLVIEAEEEGKRRELNHINLESVLGESQDKQRTRSGFLSGKRAHGAFQALKSGVEHILKTKMGGVQLHLRWPVADGQSRIDLCRNGMWVADIKTMPVLRTNIFTDHKVFHCVILLNAQDGGELHELVKKSEGPLHNSLTIKNLSKPEQRAIRGAFTEIRNHLKEVVPQYEAESFAVEDVFTLQMPGDVQAIGSGARPAVRGQATRTRQRRPGQSRGKEQSRVIQRTKKPFTWSGKPLMFSALPVPTGNRSCQIELIPNENCQGSEVRLLLDESVDITCDEQSRGASLELFNVEFEGRRVPDDALVKDAQQRTIGVSLGDLQKEQRYTLKVDYALTGDLKNLNAATEQIVVPRVEVMRRTADQTSQETEQQTG